MRPVRIAWLVLAAASISIGRAQTFNVFAAASLKETATEISKHFEKQHPNYVVSINFGGSQQLAAQIRMGAPVDILLSAGLAPLKGLAYDKTSLRIFATNELALIVPTKGSRVRTWTDLGRNARLIIADRHVPVGDYTEKMLVKAQRDLGAGWVSMVRANVVSQEQDVRAVLTKVELGEADAGIVYTTDVLSAKGKVKVIPIPIKYNVQAVYPAVCFAGSVNADVAKEFMHFLMDKDAQAILSKHGFRLPVASAHH